jgi:hypothetical protein
MVTCAVYLPSFGRLVCGQADGSIAVLSALQAATVLMLQARKFSRGKDKVSLELQINEGRGSRVWSSVGVTGVGVT